MKVYPDLEMLFAVPNGGHRHPSVAKKMKAEGVKPGIPDIFLDVARKGFHGLRIELKAPAGPNAKPGALSAEQLERLTAYGERGYLAVACWGWAAARDTIVNYLS